MPAIIDFASLEFFQLACLVVATTLLLWDSVEVGRNDAANLINSVFGAGVLRRRPAIIIAGIAVIFGAAFSSDVIDTARKGIFTPTALDGINAALAIYVSVYVVDTVLLYSYSAFGMPVSTTACLVFELLGASFAVQASAVNWDKAGKVVFAIVCSILMSGIAAFMVQRAVRGSIRDKTRSLTVLLLHGGWVGGGMLAALSYYMILKGMKNVAWVKTLRKEVVEEMGAGIVFVMLWAFFAILVHLSLVIFRKKAARLLFPVLAIIGMISMSFAFGQNDLANCASPGLATINLLEKGDLTRGSEGNIPRWMLVACGCLLFIGMTTRNAHRVTKAAVAAGSAQEHVALWSPRWCVALARFFLKFKGKSPALAPRVEFTASGSVTAFDSMRASVIMSTAACVIATASSLGLPVSTTYVTFAAVVCTGLADRIFQRGDASLKLGRAIWVVTSWFTAAVVAAIAAGIVAFTILKLGVFGIAVTLVANLGVRRVLSGRADRLEMATEEEAHERMCPDDFALEDEEV